MTNKMTKFLTMGTLALAMVVGVNALTQNQNTDSIQTPVVAQQVQQNEHGFIHTRFDIGPYTPGAHGEARQIMHDGHVIGQIKQFERHQEIKSNLNAEQTSTLFKELKDSGQLPNLKMNTEYKSSEEIAQNPEKNIVLDQDAKVAMSDMEQVILTTSMSFKTTEPTLSKFGSISNMQTIRKNAQEQTHGKSKGYTVG